MMFFDNICQSGHKLRVSGFFMGPVTGLPPAV
ncbi:hypothetical protein AGR7B_Cc10397 [Agrobacterium deltaense RV3]|nr:hypothetical protein AGR7B_Cc10397 [Agrobacterium deltaense RV3]